ncbi:DNA cytosine methyltransferase [Rhizobium lentis]|uniref:DNA (cytosine-5-)-methyltransferase n=1 Tax=Rhizobium lentis TaxID=1138194 RepID=A0A7W8UMC1_9HYPH|nr:DNA cytosine methyltransferase [Rhizobium lentis]MBB4574409.1 DNA (cytosine-5)-methyltransferase 1 [Rhizobium lentis]MBB5550335.1 DNA (cytosine-5)-methyltransferase 1 [Rhizobium lentis]MBB5560636.1 DNA (cytosine-5)-methyltransferase 1 [Rhizobium lentis]MBB5567221.1 DNA (cytosine-5)-methyltransferase 1 [Rhizobium lentis]
MNSMAMPKSFVLDNRMTVVLFAGMGGGCDGLEDAGFHVHLAVNHDPLAIAMHEKRHPHTRHLRCDVFEVDPRQATRGRGVRILHASPDCTHFSVAKGSKPVSKRRRSLAWVIPRWAGQVRPEVITMENVQEIRTWGPLICKRDKKTGRAMRRDGSVAAKGERIPVENQWLIPDPRHKGRIWRAWLQHMQDLGYSFEHRILVCADYGIPTIRKRFFGVARADGGPIYWPERTHAPRDKAKALGLKPWVGANTIIDWSLPVKSIFDRKKPLAEATLRRIARGVMRYVVNAKRPFIVPITHTGGDRVHDIDEPMRTFTTAHRGELALVVPVIAGVGGRMGQSAERSVEEPMQTVTTKPDSVLVAAHLTKFRPGSTGAHVEEPLPTYTANNFEKRPGGAPPLGVAAVHMSTTRNAQKPFGAADEPLHTITAGGAGLSLVAATMIQAGNGEHEGQVARCLDIENPIGTQTAGGQRQAVVAAFLAQHNGDPRADGSVEFRSGRDVADPLATLTVYPQQGVGAVFLAQHNTGNNGHDARDPLSTVTTGGERGQSQQGIVAAALTRLRGNDKDGQDISHPLPTQTCGGGHEMLIMPFLQAYYGSGSEGGRADEPLRALTGLARHGLVTVQVNGQTMVITDICMRMLDPLEGAAAHGFDPKSFDHVIEYVDERGKLVKRKPTKTQIGHLVGNSVPKKMIQLLAECNGRYEFVEAAE